MDDIQRSIRSMLVEDLFVEVPEDRIGLDDGLRTTFGIDSLGFVELRVQCEDAFGVTISDEDFYTENFTSIRTISELVLKLRQETEAKV
ncbi:MULTISPECIES: acyl carrier protein [Actinosynnema]|uniref:acyl carrier protein n=1 Tax=Actinosynnema TaxID=40566 RepID=UPI0020A30872|nr:acyl carrier protein [Actinosynnema pretiosum]